MSAQIIRFPKRPPIDCTAELEYLKRMRERGGYLNRFSDAQVLGFYRDIRQMCRERIQLREREKER